MISNESICINGTVKGKVKCKGSVVVGQEGKVMADIFAENAFIGGQVNGNITTKNRLEITSAGRVKGDIATVSLAIAEGVVFEGRCLMVPEKGAEPSSSADSNSTLKKGPEIVKNPHKISSGESQ